MEESAASGDGDPQNIPPGVHGMTTVLDATNGAEETHEQPIAIDRLAVIVPVYNEERTVAELLRRLEAQPCVSQIIIVDDGSTDHTREELAIWQAHRAGSIPVTIVDHHINRGKGRAIQTGIEHVTCSHVLIQDADLEYDPSDIRLLFEVVTTGEADVAYGSRYIAKPQLASGRFVLQSGIRFINLLCRLLYGIRLTDEATCYKLFRVTDLRRMDLECEQFEFCPEVTAKSARMGLRIGEVNVTYSPRHNVDGKKYRIRDGFVAAWELFRWCRWFPG